MSGTLAFRTSGTLFAANKSEHAIETREVHGSELQNISTGHLLVGGRELRAGGQFGLEALGGASVWT